VPALGYAFLTRLYDPLVRLLGEEKFKRRLVEHVGLQRGHRALDVGCGTATLTIMLKRACPGAVVVGLDGDFEVLARARAKARTAGTAIGLCQALASAPPFPPRSFDRIVSSLLFHHLSRRDKRRTLRQLYDLLRPGGELHIADWGRPQNFFMRLAFFGVQLLDGFATTQDHVRGRLERLMRDAGFEAVRETHREMTLLGTLAFYVGIRPAR
jgi:ubiquinone/menaquinone biosynthesis C-methylase UbiE